MKLEIHSRWLRVLIELFPALPAIRRYRISASRQEGPTGRYLQRKIARELGGDDLGRRPVEAR